MLIANLSMLADNVILPFLFLDPTLHDVDVLSEFLSDPRRGVAPFPKNNGSLAPFAMRGSFAGGCTKSLVGSGGSAKAARRVSASGKRPSGDVFLEIFNEADLLSGLRLFFTAGSPKYLPWAFRGDCQTQRRPRKAAAVGKPDWTIEVHGTEPTGRRRSWPRRLPSRQG